MLARDRSRPFSTRISRSRMRRGRRYVVHATVRSADGRRSRLSRTVRACAGRAAVRRSPNFTG